MITDIIHQHLKTLLEKTFVDIIGFQYQLMKTLIYVTDNMTHIYYIIP